MSQPLKPSVMIAIIAVVIVVLIVIGYKALGPSNAPERTDAAHQQAVAAYAAKHKGAPSPPGAPPMHP